MTLWQGNRGLLHAPAHEMVLADGSLQRGVKNVSGGHCLGTLEKRALQPGGHIGMQHHGRSRSQQATFSCW